MITPKTRVCPTPPPNKISSRVMMSLIAYFPSSDKKGVSQVADANPKPFLTSPLLIRGRVAEAAREHGWHPPKSLDSDKNFKPEHTLFCRELRFVAIYALFFGDLWA